MKLEESWPPKTSRDLQRWARCEGLRTTEQLVTAAVPCRTPAEPQDLVGTGAQAGSQAPCTPTSDGSTSQTGKLRTRKKCLFFVAGASFGINPAERRPQPIVGPAILEPYPGLHSVYKPASFQQHLRSKLYHD